MANSSSGEKLTRHTPGPWRAHYDDGYCQVKGGRGYYSGPRIDTGFELSGFASKANAALIAAAPDLLAALKEIAAMEHSSAPVNAVTRRGVVFEIAAEAIARAKGGQ